jgi:hypothetical protein
MYFMVIFLSLGMPTDRCSTYVAQLYWQNVIARRNYILMLKRLHLAFCVQRANYRNL